MNQLVSIDSILEPTTALAPATLFGSGQVETILAAIEKYVRAEVFDIATAEGRERIKSVAYKIARSKTTLDEIGKEHVAEIKKQSAAIDAERRTIRERLDALKDEVRGPLTAWEEAEANRISGHEAALVTILSEMHAMATPRQLREHKADLEELAGRDWQEFGDRAVAAFNEAMPKLVARIEAAEQRERDQAELEALRKEKAEREARDERERNQRIADELRATQARIEAERERERAEQRERDRQAAEERAKKQAEEAAARAIEQERQRVAAEEARKAAEKAAQEAAERKRQENKRHRERVHARIKAALLLEMGDAEADRLIRAIASGDIPHVSINY